MSIRFSSVFSVNKTLEADTIAIGDLKLCRVLLMNNALFPWLILVPRVENMRELFELSADDYKAAMNEIRKVSQQFATLTNADKMNVAALGNLVPQLHIHIIARFKTDAAWPQPVWNNGAAATAYAPEKAATLAGEIRRLLNITKM